MLLSGILNFWVAFATEYAFCSEKSGGDTPISPLDGNIWAYSEDDLEILNTASENQGELDDTLEPHGSSREHFLSALGKTAVSALNPIVSDTFFSSLEEKLEYFTDLIPIDDEKYDYIVIGCGASGCPLAAALAEREFNVLILERGMERSFSTTPNAMDIRGAGIGLADQTITQSITTKQGVITFAGSVMGGGTSVNLGITIADTEDFFEAVENKFPGFHLDKDTFNDAVEYSLNRVASPMPALDPLGGDIINALSTSGFEPLGGGPVPLPTGVIPKLGVQWQGMTLFNAEKNFFRTASDTFIEDLPNLTLKTRVMARKITFSNTREGPVAECVVYRNTKFSDIKPIGKKQDIIPSSASNWAPWIGTFLQPTSILSLVNNSKNYRRACLKNSSINKGSRIILSAGTINSATILFRSGIGPTEVLKEIGAPRVYINPHVGTSVSDRILVPVCGFLSHHHDKIGLQPIDSSKDVRRLESNESPNANEKILKLSKPAKRLNKKALIKSVVKTPKEIVVIEEADSPSRFINIFEPPAILPDKLVYPKGLKRILKPRISQFMGITQMGSKCTPTILDDENLRCSTIPFEELSGFRIAEGFLYASRLFFPPLFRNDPIIDGITDFLHSCSNLRPPFNLAILKPLCAIAFPVIKCFRKVYAPFYFTSEPKSRGTLTAKANGNISFDPKYLVDKKDLFDAIRGTSMLIEQINGDAYKNILQPKGPASCPLTIGNGLLDILLIIANSTSPFVTDLRNFKAIHNYLQDLILPEQSRLRRRIPIDMEVEPAVYVDGEGNEYEDYSAHVIEEENLPSEINSSDSTATTHHNSQNMLEMAINDAFGGEDSDQLEKYTDRVRAAYTRRLSETNSELKEHIDECFKVCKKDSLDDHTCPGKDLCCQVFGNSKCIPMSQHDVDLPDGSTDAIYSSNDFSDISRSSVNNFTARLDQAMLNTPRNPQWAATFPPTLPNVNNHKAVAKFALSYMTSIGHLYGSAPMGTVVDTNFNVIGVKGLSVVDGSVLPQLPRMNPTITLLALGRYAAEKISN